MNFELLALPAVLLVSLTGIILLVSSDWRVSTAALAFQYVGVFVFVVMSWPIEMAIVKLITGWMACTVLAIAAAGAPGSNIEEQGTIMNVLFRLLAAGLVGLVVDFDGSENLYLDSRDNNRAVIRGMGTYWFWIVASRPDNLGVKGDPWFINSASRV